MPLLLKGWLLIVAGGWWWWRGGMGLDNKMYQKEWVKCKIMSVKSRGRVIYINMFKWLSQSVILVSRGESERLQQWRGKRQWKAWGASRMTTEEIAKWGEGCRQHSSKSEVWALWISHSGMGEGCVMRCPALKSRRSEVADPSLSDKS